MFSVLWPFLYRWLHFPFTIHILQISIGKGPVKSSSSWVVLGPGKTERRNTRHHAVVRRKDQSSTEVVEGSESGVRCYSVFILLSNLQPYPTLSPHCFEKRSSIENRPSFTETWGRSSEGEPSHHRRSFFLLIHIILRS